MDKRDKNATSDKLREKEKEINRLKLSKGVVNELRDADFRH